MFCVIQEVQTKKPDKDGYPKELISKYMKMSISGRDCSHYYYSYSEERFERPIKSSYRISIHSSFRKNGKPQKRQFVICTVKYYDLATDYFTLYDWGDSRIQAAAHELQVSPADIYSLIDAKLEPLKDRIISAFHQTEEYKTHEEHERITTIYAARKVQFAEQYEIDASEYDCVYDVFGNLRNPEYLKKIQDDYKLRKECERKRRSYQKKTYSNYSGYYSGTGGSSYGVSVHGNYTEGEKTLLKQFYRELSKRFHPDSNPGEDTSEHMKLLNRLKNEWGV